MLISFAALAVGAVMILPLYQNGQAITKNVAAVLFVFRPETDRDRAALDSCTGWVRHVGRFRESRMYEFRLDCQLSKGDAEVLLLDSRKRELLRLNRHSAEGKIALNKCERYYLRWEFRHATGSCALRW